MNVAVLTGGGDCPGLNAVIRAVYKTGKNYGYTMYGIKNGFKGLVENDIFMLTPEYVSGILHRGGTILGTTNRDNPFHYFVGNDIYVNASQQAIDNLKKHSIDVLIVIGGDGSLSIAHEFSQMGVKIIGIPKTIDNDLKGTERTFGFDSAISVAAEALDRLHTTAESHHRVQILEVMGRTAGWIALHAGIAGGADIILIPEIPYRIEKVIAKISERKAAGKLFSIIVVAEGAHAFGEGQIVKKIIEHSHEKVRLGGIGDKLAQDIEDFTGIESRSTTLGHLQRGGSPTAFDRILSTRYGERAVSLIQDNLYGKMVALKDNQIITTPLSEVAGKAYTIPEGNSLLKTARLLNIGLGE